jgi:hypothetical protein
MTSRFGSRFERRRTGRRGAAEIAARPLPFSRYDLSAGERARRQREEQQPVADRADRSSLKKRPGGSTSGRACNAASAP